MMNFRLRTLSACVALMGSAGIAHGAGFNLLEQSASGLGNAYAGSAASVENASAMYYNPAALTQLEGFQISTGVNFIRPSFKFKDEGSTVPGAKDKVINPQPKGGNGGDAGGWGTVPNLFLSYKVNDRIGVGLGISAPFGLKTEYDADWVGRYHSQSFDIKTININPAIAFKINDSWSVGAGINIQRIDATYEKSNIHRLKSDEEKQYPAFLEGLGFSVNSKTKIKNTAYGWNVGIMFHPSEDTRIGLSYRSKVKHKASGHTTIYGADDPAIKTGLGQYLTQIGSEALSSNNMALAQGINRYVAELKAGKGGLTVPTRLKSKATVTLPDTLTLSAYHRLNEKWEVMGDIAWTGWSSISQLTIDSVGTDAPGKNTTGIRLKFRDTWRVAIGANYAVNEKWKIKMGLAYDQAPIRSDKYRPVSLPDKDRYWLSLGVQYKPTENTTVDVGYAHMFVKNFKINNDNGNANTYGSIKGSYKGKGDIFGLQLSHRF